MKRNLFPDNDGEAICCIQCGKLIPDSSWFAHFRVDDRWVTACRPFCLEKFLDDKEHGAAQEKWGN
jgi:hypothetical protein